MQNNLAASIRNPLLSPESQKADGDQRDGQSMLSRMPSLSIYAAGTKVGIIKNKPVIFLEILTGRVMMFIILITFLTFGLCQWTDFESIAAGAQASSYYHLGSRPCSSAFTTTTGCMKDQLWQGQVNNLNNIVSVSLEMTYSNFTISSSPNEVTVIPVPYQVSLWACYHEGGCGNDFSDSYSDNNPSQWHSMIMLGSKAEPEYTYILPTLSASALSVPIFNLTFQNQESIPTQGIVKSYYCAVQFYLPDASVPSVTDIAGTENLEFAFQITNRPPSDAQKIFCILLLFFTLACIWAYHKIVKQEQGVEWMAEQKWCLAYFIVLFLYQNPVYSIIAFLDDVPSSWVYASYFIDRTSQASFLVLWLLFGDSPNYYDHVKGSQPMISTEWWWFYLPKVAYGVSFFAVSIIVLTYQFPDLAAQAPNHVRSPVEAVSNWPSAIQVQFIIFSISYLFLFWIWVMWWLFKMYVTVPRQLCEKPYMKTRYLQLSFRFFRWQGTLVFLYYVIQYSVVMYSMWSKEASLNVGTFTEEINALFRQQTHLFGKILFLTVYGVLLAFCFLPASFMANPETNVLASSYVIREKDVEKVVHARHRYIKKITYAGVMNKLLTHSKAEVFCVELGLDLLNISWEAYYDAPSVTTLSSAGPMNIEQYGYELIDVAYDPAVETFCLVCRHKSSNKIVIAFRGTVNGQHWKSNLDYGKKPLDLAELTIPELDAEDGLQLTSVGVQNPTHERSDSFSDDDSFVTAGSARLAEQQDHGQDNSTADPSTLPRTKTLGQALTTAAEKGVKMAGSAYNKTTAAAMKAAKKTPGLRSLVQTRVHTGFWTAYNANGIRSFVHKIVRTELKKSPGKVYITGHSLGGAISTFCALDLAIHTMPRINAYHKSRAVGDEPYLSALAMFNFGSPKVGNNWFKKEFNRIVPDAFRVVVDGDIVASLPAYGMGYDHIGTEVVIDGNGYGSIIIDQSFVERRLRPRRTGIAVHQMARYRKGLEGILSAGLALMDKEAPGEAPSPSSFSAKPISASKTVYQTEKSSSLEAELHLELGMERSISSRSLDSSVMITAKSGANTDFHSHADEPEDTEELGEDPSFLAGVVTSMRSLFLDKEGQQQQMEKELGLRVEQRASFVAEKI